MNVAKKIIKHFADKKFKGVQLDTFRHTKCLFQQNILLLFFNIHEKYVLYQTKKIISTIHWCCQQNIYSVKFFGICISKSFMRPRFFFYHPLAPLIADPPHSNSTTMLSRLLQPICQVRQNCRNFWTNAMLQHLESPPAVLHS